VAGGELFFRQRRMSLQRVVGPHINPAIWLEITPQQPLCPRRGATGSLPLDEIVVGWIVTFSRADVRDPGYQRKEPSHPEIDTDNTTVRKIVNRTVCTLCS